MLYQSYNATYDAYGVMWHDLAEACVAVRYFSKVFQSTHCVVDRETGEVLRIYKCGEETYRAQ